MVIGYATVALTWDGIGSPGTNTWSLRTTGSDFGAATEPEGLMEIVRQFYLGVDQNLRTGLVMRWDGVFHGRGVDEGNTKAFPAWTLTAPGSASDEAEALAVCVNWRGATGGRRGRGRNFFGPLADTAIGGTGEFLAAVVTEFQAAANALVTSSTGFTNGAIGIHSRLDGVTRDVTSAVVSPRYAVLRSRRD